ncbi:SAV_2336 N-terminal domain-related protein, partial [Streptomyces sp. st170]|uniref:SAV_2336 N-terminal domain-related protein n=1 Tax=Streptomyces sp. st170 TaxID=1828058 RepID=UPI0027BA3FF4
MNGLPRERAPDAASAPTASPDRATGVRSEDDSPYDQGGADWTGLADAAWLAAARIGADRATGPAPDEPPHAEELPDTPGPLLEAVPDPSTRPEPDVVPGVTGLPGAPAYEREILTSVERTRTGPAQLPGRGPRTVRRGPSPLARSLRGLGRRVPTGGRSALDEESTAEHGLTDGLWVPYFLPDRERAFDLVLLVDRAPTMPPWRGTVRQIADEAAHSGAFRDVRTVGVTLPPGAGEPALRWPGGRDGDPAELIDGRSSRLFLVVTDGLAPGWAGAGADRLLERLASGGPTALVHLLPPYLRHRSSLFPFRAQLDAGGFGAPNRRFHCRPPLGAHDPVRPLPEPDDETVPVPVLSVRAGSFRAWADLVTGERGVRRMLPVVLAGAMAKGASAPGLRRPVVDGPVSYT